MQDKKHTLVIGGTRGIGRALVRLLSQNNHIVSVIGKYSAARSNQCLPNVRYYLADLSSRKPLSAVLKKIIYQRGKLNNLIFFQRYRGEGDSWQGEIEISLTATKNIIESLINEFDNTHNEKSIIIISSVASHFVASEQPLSYHVAKAGLNQMVRYYAVNLGNKGIRVNSILPATVLKDESKRFYLKNKKLYNLHCKISPLGRMGTADEIAEVIKFLCSEGASLITGQCIVVDGGISLLWHESLARQLTGLGNMRVSRRKRPL